MTGKWKIGIAVSVLLLSGCAKASTLPKKNEPLTLVIATDLHYLAPELHDQGERFQRLIEESDGKLTEESEALADQFVQEMLQMKPQAVLLSGDLTFNGEKLSHQRLAQKLQVLTEAGIDVWVIPGNHDLNNPSAASFSQAVAQHIESVSAAEFAAIYQNLSRHPALSCDPQSLSCLVPLAEDVQLLLIDANRPEDPGVVSEETQRWIETQLEKAQADQRIVLSLSHQNLADHTTMFSSGFTVRGAESVRALLGTYDVRVNFSGHMHIQHIQKQDGLTDIATSSLSVAPLHYGVITLDADRTLHYQTESLTDPDLQSQARLCFDQTTRRQTQRALEALELSPQEKAAMVELAVTMNDEIFEGTLAQNAERILQDPAWGLWQSRGKDLFFGQYLQAMLSEAKPGNNEITIALR